MSPFWDTLLARALQIVERLIQLWLAFKSGEWKAKTKSTETIAEIKDEQNKIAADRPGDRDDLVRRLRERGF